LATSHCHYIVTVVNCQCFTSHCHCHFCESMCIYFSKKSLNKRVKSSRYTLCLRRFWCKRLVKMFKSRRYSIRHQVGEDELSKSQHCRWRFSLLEFAVWCTLSWGFSFHFYHPMLYSSMMVPQQVYNLSIRLSVSKSF